MPAPRLTSLLAVALALAASLGCAHGGGSKPPATAEDDYKLGQKDFESKNYPEAQKTFEHIRNKYPYSKYAALAELRLADLKLESDRLIEAADAYQMFVKMHPSHEQADYAAFRVGLAYWKDAPSDFLLFPPAIEKDQHSVVKALAAWQDFLKAYPGSKYLPEAEKLLVQAKGRLADHEWYVAQFYRKRSRWAGAAVRLEGLVRDYPGSKYESEALLELAGVYLEMSERFRAQQALQQLIVNHPQDPRRPEAEKLLAGLR